MEKLDFEMLKNHNQIVDRYLELYPCKDKEKVDTAMIIISYSIQDINVQIKSYNDGVINVGVFYQLIIKTDLLIGAVNYLFNTFFNNSNIKVDDEIKSKIDKFRLIRNLSIAHPLSTSKFDNYGFGKENDKWCEDVIPFSSYMLAMNKNEKADYVLKYKEKGVEHSQRMFLTLKETFLEPITSILNKMNLISNNLKLEIEKKEQELRELSLNAKPEMSIGTYVEELKKDLLLRYPKEIEKYKVEDWRCVINEQVIEDKIKLIEIEHSVLNDVKERIELKFADEKRMKSYNIYIMDLIKATYKYGASIQNMDLEESDAESELKNLLYPSNSVLVDNSNKEQAYYRYSKIEYIEGSDEYTLLFVLKNLQKYSEADWRDGNLCTNLEFGMMQLWSLKEEIVKYFPIDFTYSDKNIYIQYLVALYYANKRCTSDE